MPQEDLFIEVDVKFLMMYLRSFIFAFLEILQDKGTV